MVFIATSIVAILFLRLSRAIGRQAPPHTSQPTWAHVPEIDADFTPPRGDRKDQGLK